MTRRFLNRIKFAHNAGKSNFTDAACAATAENGVIHGCGTGVSEKPTKGIFSNSAEANAVKSIKRLTPELSRAEGVGLNELLALIHRRMKCEF